MKKNAVAVIAIIVASMITLLACDSRSTSTVTDGGGDSAPHDTAGTPSDGADGQVGDDAGLDAATNDVAGDDAGLDTTTNDMADAQEIAQPLPELSTHAPVSGPIPNPLDEITVKSCALYRQQTCDGGVSKRCVLYDTKAKQFVETPDPLLHRVLLYDRWYDLYHSPNGLRVDRLFNKGIAPGTDEAIWGSLENFARFGGAGDSALHAWPAIVSKALRYVLSGTEADYQRLEREVRRYLLLFQVTGIPGYLARAHLLYYDRSVADGAPKTDQHVIWYGDEQIPDHRDFVFDPTPLPQLPAAYTVGLKNGLGELEKGKPMWHGNPSIDSYTGATVALPFVYGLLRDDGLKQLITTHLTCYLKRLRRIEVINIQQNPDVLAAINALIAGGGYQLDLDPDDIDLSKQDTLVAYYLPSLNSESVASYDKSCPDTVALTPTRVIDAAAPTWQVELINVALDLQSSQSARKTSIDHIYVPSVRGGDAIHLMHLATIAYHLTGDEQYREFLYKELIGKLQADKVAQTTSALRVPDWCGSYYGDHITISPLWSLLTLLGDGPLKTELQRVMEIEIWQKRARTLRSLKYNLFYVAETPDSIATEKALALQQFLTDLPNLHGNSLDPVVKDDPRRNYDIPLQYVLDHLPPQIGLRCPSDAERTFCEEGVNVLGIQFPIEQISGVCTQSPGECTMGDGKCVRPLPTLGLPPGLRYLETSWYGSSPYEMGRTYPVQGTIQSPGLELTEPYWLGRWYGLLTGGAGQVLAWKPEGTCN